MAEGGFFGLVALHRSAEVGRVAGGEGGDCGGEVGLGVEGVQPVALGVEQLVD